MSKNKKLLVVVALLLLVAVSFTSYAIFKSKESVSGNIAIAKWNVSFTDGTNAVSSTVPLTFDSSDCPATTHKAAGVIAPGATCTKQFVIDADDTEVSVHWTASAGTVEDGSGNAVSGVSASLSAGSGDILYSDATRTATVTVTVTWTATDDSPTDTVNDADTALAGGTLTVPIDLVAIQKLS
jgi:hypothetical protein